ncbi:MAG: hypothetical protein WKF31_08380 [Thermoleophilaceae bacterium]
MLGERLGPLEAERLADQRVVAHLGVRVEGKVVGGQGEVGGEQGLEAALLLEVEHSRLLVPQDPVVAEDEVRARGSRAVEQLAVRGDPAHHDPHLPDAGHLEAVRAEVGPLARVEELVEEGDQLVAPGHRPAR